jgi:hypothetical protein
MKRLLGFYFFPTIIGWEKRDGFSIFMFNLLLGWTIIGWIAAWFWASGREAEPVRSLNVVSKHEPASEHLNLEETKTMTKPADLVA